MQLLETKQNKFLLYIKYLFWSISYILLDYIIFENEYIFSMYRFVFISFFKLNPIVNANIDIGSISVIFLIIYFIVCFIFYKNKIYLIFNQIFLLGYLFLNIYPVIFGNFKLSGNYSSIYFFINLIIIMLLNITNIVQIKNLKV